MRTLGQSTRMFSLLLAVLLSTVSHDPRPAPPAPYRFTYSVDSAREKGGRWRYLVRCRLHNDSRQPLCYLAYSCNEFSGLRVHTERFRYEPVILCNASYPMVVNLPAGGLREWTVAFSSALNDPITLAFDLYRLRRPEAAHIIHDGTVPATNILALAGAREPVGAEPIRDPRLLP